MVGRAHGTKSISRLICASAFALALLLAVPVAEASAAPSTLTISSPAQGSSAKQAPTLFAGGTDEAGTVVIVRIFEGTSTTGVEVPPQLESTAPSGGTWEAPGVALAEGTYTARAEQLNAETTETEFSEPVTFTVDAVAPIVRLNAVTSPTKDSTPTFTGTLGGAPGDDQAVSVAIYEGSSVGGTPVASGQASVNGSNWSFTSSSLAGGTYTAQASQDDRAGNEGLSAPATFVIDTTAPAVTLTPLASFIGSGQPTFAGAAGTASGDLPAVKLKLYKGSGVSGSPLETVNVTASGASWSSSAEKTLSEGTYTAIAEQADEAGNVGVSGPSTFTVKTKPPAVSLDAVAAWTKDSTPSFEGAAGTAKGDLAEVVVTVHEGATVGGAVAQSGRAAVSGAKWSYAVPRTLPDGTYTVVASQEDAAGNVGSAGPSTFTIDTTPPAVSLNAGAIAPLSNDASPTFSGAAGATPGDAATVSVLVHEGASVGGAVVAKETVQVTNGGWSWTTHLPDGSYTVQAIQLDEAGNEGRSNSATFKIDTTPPTLSITSPKSHETTISSGPTFSGTTNNGPGEPTGVTIEIFSGESVSGTLVQSLEVTRNNSSWTTASSGPRLSNGTYTVRVKEADVAGNVGESPAVTFTVASPSPIVTLDALPTYTNNVTPTFAGVAATSEAKQEVTVKVWRGRSSSGELAEMVTVPETGGAWSASLSKALAQGTYTAQAEQPAEHSDPAGVSDTTTFVVDTTPPIVTLVAPPTSSGLETVSGVAGADAGDRRQVTVELFDGMNVEPGNAFEALTVNSVEGTWSATFAGLAPGEYAVIARQSDEAGNIGTSDASTFTVASPPTSTGPSQPSAPSAPSPPNASFTWLPTTPTVGQSVSLVSSSTDPSSAIDAFAWDLAGAGQFAPGGPATTTSFATAGPHLVRLRVSDGNGLSSTASETIDVVATPPKLMQPFPIVRIAGSETGFGVSVRLLTVQAPLGAKVTITCVGRGCKTKGESRVAKASSKGGARAGAVTLAFTRFERPLYSGALLQIRVTQSGEIGKFTSFAIRRKRLPARTDACLPPASSKPTACPSS
jgi:uncharacterized protein (DUF2141 family)